MAVVKADGYGHGLVPAARAALAGGADSLGVAVLDEALALRAAGITAPVLAWLHGPGHRLRRRAGRRRRGVGERRLGAGRGGGRGAGDRPDRAGAPQGRHGALPRRRDAGGLAGAGRRRRPRAGRRATSPSSALWSHMAYADAPTHPTIGAQVRVFEEAVGRRPRTPASPTPAGTWPTRPRPSRCPHTWYDLVRPGIALYGLDPLGGDPAAHGLRPAMTVRAAVALTKRVPAGVGVSYGHTYFPDRETTLALVPVGYADGVPRAAGNRAPVLAGGEQRTIAGRVCMDQFVLDVGDDPVAPGDEVVLWGPGDARRADGAAVGRRRRHHPLRAGHPGRRPLRPPLRRLGGGGLMARRKPKPNAAPHSRGHTVGVVGALLGLAAAGTAAGVAVSRVARAPRPGGRARGQGARRRPAAGGRPARWLLAGGRPDGAGAGRRRRAAVGRGDRPAGRAADRRLRARLHAVDGVLGLPAADARRRAGDRERPPPGRAAGVLRPARARLVEPGSGRAVDDRAAGPATWPP